MFTSNTGTIMIIFGLMMHLSLNEDQTHDNSSRLIQIQIERDEIKNIKTYNHQHNDKKWCPSINQCVKNMKLDQIMILFIY